MALRLAILCSVEEELRWQRERDLGERGPELHRSVLLARHLQIGFVDALTREGTRHSFEAVVERPSVIAVVVVLRLNGFPACVLDMSRVPAGDPSFKGIGWWRPQTEPSLVALDPVRDVIRGPLDGNGLARLMVVQRHRPDSGLSSILGLVAAPHHLWPHRLRATGMP